MKRQTMAKCSIEICEDMLNALIEDVSMIEKAFKNNKKMSSIEILAIDFLLNVRIKIIEKATDKNWNEIMEGNNASSRTNKKDT
jgi:hypothetical protein